MIVPHDLTRRLECHPTSANYIYAGLSDENRDEAMSAEALTFRKAVVVAMYLQCVQYTELELNMLVQELLQYALKSHSQLFHLLREVLPT